MTENFESWDEDGRDDATDLARRVVGLAEKATNVVEDMLDDDDRRVRVLAARTVLDVFTDMVAQHVIGDVLGAAQQVDRFVTMMSRALDILEDAMDSGEDVEALACDCLDSFGRMVTRLEDENGYDDTPP